MPSTHSETFVQLYDTYFNRLIFHASRFVEDIAEAEDIVSDVFVELWKKIDTLNLDRGIATYLYRAVSTRALNVLRHRNVAAVRLEALQAINDRRIEFIEKTTPLDDMETQEIKGSIDKALSHLPDKCREVFILSYVNGLKSKDIAAALGISVRTVEAHIYKALRLMREQLKHLLVLIILFWGIE